METEITEEIKLKLAVLAIADAIEESFALLDLDKEQEELLQNIQDEINIKIHDNIFPLVDNLCKGGNR